MNAFKEPFLAALITLTKRNAKSVKTHSTFSSRESVFLTAVFNWVKTCNAPAATQSLALLCNKDNVQFPSVLTPEETAVMFVLKAESGLTINVSQNLKLILLFVSPVPQPTSSIREMNARERRKDVLSTSKIFALHVSQPMFSTPSQENASEDHQVVFTTKRLNVFHAKANTFTIKANKDVSSLVALNTLKTADALNAHFFSS